jgi:hypothetical protein
VDAVQVDEAHQAVDDDAVPLAPAVLTAADEYEVWIDLTQRQRPALRDRDVFLGLETAELPVPVHLVAETPVPHVVRGLVSVGSTQVGPVRVAGAVAVLDPGQRLVEGPGTHVQAQVRLGAEPLAVGHELVGAERVGLLGLPREIRPAWPLVARPHAVDPVVAADEVATRPAQQRHAQSLGRVEHVAPESVLVGLRRVLVEHAAVNASAEMLDEAPEDTRVDAADHAVLVDLDAGHALASCCRPHGLIRTLTTRSKL